MEGQMFEYSHDIVSNTERLDEVSACVNNSFQINYRGVVIEKSRESDSNRSVRYQSRSGMINVVRV